MYLESLKPIQKRKRKLEEVIAELSFIDVTPRPLHASVKG
jgi:hypothetical protein